MNPLALRRRLLLALVLLGGINPALAKISCYEMDAPLANGANLVGVSEGYISNGDDKLHVRVDFLASQGERSKALTLETLSGVYERLSSGEEVSLVNNAFKVVGYADSSWRHIQLGEKKISLSEIRSEFCEN